MFNNYKLMIPKMIHINYFTKEIIVIHIYNKFHTIQITLLKSQELINNAFDHINKSRKLLI